MPHLVKDVVGIGSVQVEEKPERRKVNEVVELMIGEEWTTVFVLNQAVMQYHTTDQQAHGYAAVQLWEVELVSMKEVVEGFGIARSTLQDIREKYQAGGLAGLMPAKSGPKEAWKLVRIAKGLILDTFYQYPDWTLPQVTDEVNRQLEGLNMATLSQGHIRRFLTEEGLLPRRAKRVTVEESEPDNEQQAEPTTASTEVSQVEREVEADEGESVSLKLRKEEPVNQRAELESSQDCSGVMGWTGHRELQTERKSGQLQVVAHQTSPETLPEMLPEPVEGLDEGRSRRAEMEVKVVKPGKIEAERVRGLAMVVKVMVIDAALSRLGAGKVETGAVSEIEGAVVSSVALEPAATPWSEVEPDHQVDQPKSKGQEADNKANQTEGQVREQSKPARQTAADRVYLARLREGVDTAYGGGLLLVPFLLLIQFPGLINSHLSGLAGGYYGLVQLGLTFFYLVLFGLFNLEQVKRMSKGEFGLLLGRRRSPGLTLLRSCLRKLARLGQAEAMALTAAAQLIQAGMVDWQVLFIDGHFIPYYGYRRLRKGYFTTRRMPLKGHEAYYANDRQGRPLFFLLGPTTISLIAILPEIVKKVKQIMGPQWEAWCLSLVFDRGGFCAELFQKLDQEKVHWITWLKAAQDVWKQVYQIPEEKFKLALLKLKSKKVVVKLCEWSVPIPAYGDCRAIILLDRKSGKRMVIITNDQERSTQEVAQTMLGRWSQENFFKVMLVNYDLDGNPTRQFEPEQTDPLVANPRLKELRRLKKKLQARKQKLESELGQKAIGRKREKASLKQLKKDNDKRVRAIKSLEREIERLNQELAQTPDKVPLSQIWQQPQDMANLEAKRFLDLMKCLAFNGEEWLLERLLPHYRGKDVRQVLRHILGRGAEVQLVGELLYVRLKPFDSPKIQAAAEGLCRELTALLPTTLDKFGFRIIYQVLPAT